MRRLFQHATWYTCPLLMTIQWALMRLALRPVYWRDGALYRRVTRGRPRPSVLRRSWRLHGRRLRDGVEHRELDRAARCGIEVDAARDGHGELHFARRHLFDHEKSIHAIIRRLAAFAADAAPTRSVPSVSRPKSTRS